MPIVRNHMSMMRIDVWQIQRHVGIVHQRQAWPRSRMSRMPWLLICMMLMPPHVTMIIDVSIIPVVEHLNLTQVLQVCVCMQIWQKNRLHRRVLTLQILQLQQYIFHQLSIQSHLLLNPHQISYDVPLRSTLL